MNYLAHLVLADDTPASMIGNLMPDLHRGRLPEGLDPVVLEGVRRHRRVDAFTDSHPLFERSRGRLRPRHGRYAGILVDVFYDHFLSVHWGDFHPRSRAEFIDLAYRAMWGRRDLMPPRMCGVVGLIVAQDWLSTYATVQGVEHTLWRMSLRVKERFGREVDLASAVDELVDYYDGFGQDFLEYFPALVGYLGVGDKG